ncbi:hypothetical protein A6U95_06515 [Serratia sp. 14-2641]|nr:hypothetical protein A6U95_06515 [Serratia sp. 14-2641]
MMTENSVETYPQYPCRIAASGAIHRHINNGLMGIRFSTVVAILELKGFQALLTAIELRS